MKYDFSTIYLSPGERREMGKLYFLFFTLTFFKTAAAVSTAEHDEIFRVIKSFFVRRHVRSVMAADTCWPFDVDKKLLEQLSAADISVCFCSAEPYTQTAWHRYAFLVDLSCEKSKTVFGQVSNDRLFTMQNDWILLGRNRIGNDTDSTLIASRTFETYLGDAYVLPDSGVFLFQVIDDNVWEIWNGFRASKSDTLRVFRIGTASTDYLHIDDDGFNDERKNFRGITLKSTTVIIEKENFFGFDKKISSDLDVFAHMHYEMIEMLSHQLNFKNELSITNDYGWKLSNGSFGGLTGLLEREAIDFGAAGIFIRKDRMTVIDFTVGTVALRTTAMFKQPSLSSVHNILLLPFTLEVWFVILVIILSFVFILVLFTRANDYFVEKKNTALHFQEIITLVHGAVCQQGIHLSPNFGSIRVVIFVLFLTSLFVFTSYSASIAALIQSNSNSIKSIRDIVESSMTFSAQISPYGKHYFEETDNPELKKLYNTKVLPAKTKAFITSSEGLDKIRTEFHGFLVEVISAYKIIGNEWKEEEKCGLSEIQLFKIPLLSIAVVKKSGHRDIFKQMLIRQMEVGLNKRITSQWIPPKPSCGSYGRTRQYVSVSIKEIHLTLKVFACGVGLSLAIFTFEMLHHAWTNRQGKKNLKVNISYGEKF